MLSRSTRIPRLALRASVLAALALPAGLPALAAETAVFQGVPVEVLGRSTTKIPGGSVTLIRIRPPAIPARQEPPVSVHTAPVSAEAKAALEREDAKPYSILSVTCMVYTRADGSVGVTELTWRDGERQFRAWSTADFRLLRQFSNLSLEKYRIQWMPFIDALPLAEVPAGQQPVGLQLFPASREPNALPEYYFEGSEEDAADAAPALAALDWLHAEYYLHKEQLAADIAQREAAAAEQARKAAENAAKPKEHTVFFWKIQ
jgi:hypothetical protein